MFRTLVMVDSREYLVEIDEATNRVTHASRRTTPTDPAVLRYMEKMTRIARQAYKDEAGRIRRAEAAKRRSQSVYH